MPTLAASILVGAGLGFSLAAPPGPIMAKMAFDTARGRWQQGILVGLGASSADALFFTLVAFGLLRVLPGGAVLSALAATGSLLMLFFARQALRAAREPLVAPRSRFNGWPAGFVLAATSPFNVAWWITAGAPLLDLYGPILGVGFFFALLVTVAASVWVFHLGSRRIQRFEAWVSWASALLLAGFAVWLAASAVGFLAD